MILSTYTSGHEVHSKAYWRGWGWRFDTIDRGYMRRYVFFTPIGCARVHKIMRSDNDRHPHDHPFHFVSIILCGGYVEHRPDRLPKVRLPFSVAFRRARDLHYLKLISGGPVWTFVLATLPLRRWGFQTEDGWVDARDYDEYTDKKKRDNQ